MAEISSKLVRVYGHSTDIDKFIAEWEAKYKINITSVPGWKKLIKSLEDKNKYIKKKVNDSADRYVKIIEGVLLEASNRTPHTPTKRSVIKKHKVRKSSTFHDVICSKQKERNKVCQCNNENDSDIENSKTESCSCLTTTDEIIISPNNLKVDIAEVQIEDQNELNRSVKYDTSLSTTADLKSFSYSPDPVKCNPSTLVDDSTLDVQIEQLKPDINIITFPSRLVLNFITNGEVKLNLYNKSKTIVYVRFIDFTKPLYFSHISIVPFNVVKIFPGESTDFTLRYNCQEGNANFELNIRFKTGVKSEIPEYYLLEIPILSQKPEIKYIRVPEVIRLKPIYFWQLQNSKNYAILSLDVSENAGYQLYVRKFGRSYEIIENVLEQASDLKESKLMINQRKNSHIKITPDKNNRIHQDNLGGKFELVCNLLRLSTQSYSLDADDASNNTLKAKDIQEIKEVLKMGDESEQSYDSENGTIISRNVSAITVINKSVYAKAIVRSILVEVIDTIFDKFQFEKRYFFIPPSAKSFQVKVLFYGENNVGYHQDKYCLKILNHNDELIVEKYIVIEADVLALPIIVKPLYIDMRDFYVKHGHYKAEIRVTNTEPQPCRVFFDIPNNMKKFIEITPSAKCIPAEFCAQFLIKMCAEPPRENDEALYVYCAIKVIIYSNKPALHDAPPMFLEVVLPYELHYADL